MRKRLISILLSLCMAVALLPAVSFPAAAAAVTAYYNGTGLYKDVDCTDGPIGTTSADNTFRGTITDIVFTGGATSIGDSAFYGCTALTNVAIPSDVTSIGNSAFFNCGLTGVTIPASVTSIGSGAFANCAALTAITVDTLSSSFCDVDGVLFSKDQTTLVAYPKGKNLTGYTIPSGVTSIGISAFYGCSALTSVTIPTSVTSIGERAFYGCIALTSVTIPTSVTSIGSGAFYGCTGFTSVTIPASITSFGDYVFEECIHLTSVDISEGVTSIGSDMFAYCAALTSVTIPSSVESIGSGAFADCAALMSVTILSSVTSIGDHAFYNCPSLTNVTIPSGVNSIGNGVFQNCRALTGALFLSPTPPTAIGSSVFDSCAAGFTIWVPDSSVTVYETAFSGSGYPISAPQPITVGASFNCGSLQYTVTSADLQTAAVTGSTGATGNIVIPETVLYNGKFLSVTSIGDCAFAGCSGLTSVTIPTSITSIGNYAFGGCGLVSADIPASVTSIGYCAFDCCTSLAAFTVNENNESYCFVDGVLFSKDKTTLVAYPAGKSDTGYAIPNTVTSISDYAFDYCTALKSATIPASITSIGEGVFEDCENLASVTIPSSVTSIGDYAFDYCTGLTSVTILASVTSIGEGVFEDCENLASVSIPSSVTSIGDYAFEDCYALISVTIPSSVTSIGDYAFDYCTALTRVTIPSSVTSIGENAFRDCENLASVDIPEGVTTIGNGAFERCTALTSVTIPSNVTSISNYAFDDCTALASVTIPSSVTSIGIFAFGDCAMSYVAIPANVTSISDGAFYDCTDLTDVLLRGSVTSVGASAFDLDGGAITFAVPEGTVPHYQGLMTADIMGSTTATFIETKLITAIANLPAAKSVKTGTAQSDLNLPAALTVTVGSVQETIDVTWTSSPAYSPSTAGAYTFIALLPSGYALDDSVSGTVAVTVTAPVSTGGGSTANTVTVPVSGGSGTVSVSASVSGTTAMVSATDAQLQEIASAAEAVGTVTIDLSALTADTVVVPAAIVSTTDGDSGSTGLAVTLLAGTVTLDRDALDSVKGKGDVKFSVETVDNEKLTDTQKEILGTQADSAFVVDVNVYVNGTRTSTFGDGKIQVSVPYTPKSGENTDSITVWFIKDDGTIEPKNGTYNAATGCVEFTTEHLSRYLIVSFPFADVAEDAWCYGSVACVYNNGLFAGTSGTTFSPSTAMNRQMIWMVLARMDGKVPADMGAARTWAMDSGISDGTNPTNPITREQMAVILYRYAQYKGYDTTQGGMAIREFTDYGSISEYALPALAWTVNTGLMQGSDNRVMPFGSATRAQVATILQRFCQNIAYSIPIA